MKTILKIIHRELKLFYSNKIAMLIFIAAPIVYSVLIAQVYKDATLEDLPVVVVDYDASPFSHKIIDALDDNQYIKVTDVVNSPENLRSEMEKNNLHAVITIPECFEADVQQKRYPEIDVDINSVNLLTANYISSGVQVVLASINAGTEIESLKKKGIPQAIAEKQFESFKINVTRFYNPSSNYLLFLWPGMLGTILQQVFLLVMALSFAKEFEDKTIPDLLKLSKSTCQIILAKSIPYWIIGILLWFPLIFISFPVFKVAYMTHVFTFVLVSFLFVFCLTYMGFAVSVVFDNQLKATEVLMVVAAPSFIISGQTWPLSQMPEWVQYIANCIPLTHYLEAFRKIQLLNADIFNVLPQVINLSILSVVFLAIAILMIKIRLNKELKFNALKS